MSNWGSSARLQARFPDLPGPRPEPAAFRKDTANALLSERAPHLAGIVCTTWEQVTLAARQIEARGERPAVKPVLSAAGRRFKLNDHWHSRYARMLMAREPRLAGYFETQELTA